MNKGNHHLRTKSCKEAKHHQNYYADWKIKFNFYLIDKIIKLVYMLPTNAYNYMLNRDVKEREKERKKERKKEKERKKDSRVYFLNIFFHSLPFPSYSYTPSICHLWRNVCSWLLLIFKLDYLWGFLFVCLFWCWVI